jgi:hypothetical protein
MNSNALQDKGVFVRFLPELDDDVSCGGWLEAGWRLEMPVAEVSETTNPIKS